MQEAVNYGLRVLDSAFEQLDIKAGNSDSEDEEAMDRVEAILEPKVHTRTAHAYRTHVPHTRTAHTYRTHVPHTRTAYTAMT